MNHQGDSKYWQWPSLASQLLKGEDVTAVMTRNRLDVGPLYDDRGSVTHFVGVLQEVQM
jgi:hypothetical protein